MYIFGVTKFFIIIFLKVLVTKDTSFSKYFENAWKKSY